MAMPQSLTLNTPPQSFKRQRSWVSRRDQMPAQTDIRSVDDEHQAAVKMPAYLNKSKPEISAAFQDLEWHQRFRLSHGLNNPNTSPYRVDRSIAVINRNRYGNVQPWDRSRVKLKTPIGGSDYVNASPISLKSTSCIPPLQHHSASINVSPEEASPTSILSTDSKYIATQGPKDDQFSHFWHMVMQEVVGPIGVIIMLTPCYEGNKEKCSQYFPRSMEDPPISLPAHEEGVGYDRSGAETPGDGDPFMDPDSGSTGADNEPENELEIGTAVKETDEDANMRARRDPQCDIPPGSVTLLSLNHDQSTASEVRHLRLKINDEEKDIYHYLFTGWPDYGKPEGDDRRALIELMRVSRDRAGGVTHSNPRFVHCSAGVGRTGTFIALDFLLQELESGQMSVPASTPSTFSRQGCEDGKAETWGRSGPPKAKTPDPKSRNGGKEDLIYETVNSLREQRMMMVMNEVQFALIYELVREAFIEKYETPTLGSQVEAGGVVAEPAPKITKVEGVNDIYAGTEAAKAEGGEDTMSEAETEIMDEDNNEANNGLDGISGGNQKDPYAAVAPDSIRQGLDRDL